MARDPEALFHAAIAAYDAEDWNGLAGMCDPVSLSLFRTQTVEPFLNPRPEGRLTVEDYLRHAPDMPREVAEYNVARINADSDPETRLKRDFPTVRSVEELLGMSPREVYAAWLLGVSWRMQLERQVEEGQLPRAAVDRALENMVPSMRHVVLGVVPDGERIAHIVYRTDDEPGDDPAITDPDEREFHLDTRVRMGVSVSTCRKGTDGVWRLIADHGLFGVVGGGIYLMPNESEPNGEEA